MTLWGRDGEKSWGSGEGGEKKFGGWGFAKSTNIAVQREKESRQAQGIRTGSVKAQVRRLKKGWVQMGIREAQLGRHLTK